MTESNKLAIYWTAGTLVLCVVAIGAFFWLV